MGAGADSGSSCANNSAISSSSCFSLNNNHSLLDRLCCHFQSSTTFVAIRLMKYRSWETKAVCRHNRSMHFLILLCCQYLNGLLVHPKSKFSLFIANLAKATRAFHRHLAEGLVFLHLRQKIRKHLKHFGSLFWSGRMLIPQFC